MSQTQRLPERSARPTWVLAAFGAVGFVAVLWMIEIVDAVLGHRLDQYGVRPRSDEGLIGVVTAPLLHSGWLHLEANTVPSLVLLFLVLASGIARGIQATAIVWIVGGVGVWLLAPSDQNHLGASVLVFGWLVYLIVRGIFTRRASQIALGVVLLLGFGGLLLGVLPGQQGVSWQGHLFGALGGALAAWLLGDDERQRRAPTAA